MGKKVPFTQEQIDVLQANPYTHYVSKDRLVFTLAFKEFFLEQLDVPGMTTSKILRKAGYDPSWFNEGVRDTIRRTIRHEAASPTGLKPPRGLSTKERAAAFAQKDLSRQRQEATNRELQDRIAHLEAQIAFLKKIYRLRSLPTGSTASVEPPSPQSVKKKPPDPSAK